MQMLPKWHCYVDKMAQTAYTDRVGEVYALEKHEKAFSITEAREKNIVGLALAEARRCAGLSLDELARALSPLGLDITRSGLSRWERGERTPSAYQLMALGQVLDIANPIDLYADDLNEDGLRALAAYRSELAASGRYAPKKQTQIEYIDVHLYSVAVSAGPGSFLDSDGYELVRVPRGSVPAGTDFALLVGGDSMEPVYKNGQMVFVQRAETLRPGEVGIFVHDGESLVKLYQEQTPDESVIEEFTDSLGTVRPQPVLVSFNPKYAPRPIPPASYFRILGRVLR